MSNAQPPTQQVTLTLPQEVAIRLRALAAQTGMTVESLLVQGAEKIALEEKEPAIPTPKPLWERSNEEWLASWHAWCESHAPYKHFVDDGRESIYAGRGE